MGGYNFKSMVCLPDMCLTTTPPQAISRIMVAWQPVGLAMGVYDMVARYTQQREQFGASIASYQITQEKMQRMLVCRLLIHTMHTYVLVHTQLYQRHRQPFKPCF